MVSILGISAFYHDSAAAILVDGKILAAAQDKKKRLTGRAKKREQYNRRFVNVGSGMGKKVGPNNNQARIAREEEAAKANEGK